MRNKRVVWILAAVLGLLIVGAIVAFAVASIPAQPVPGVAPVQQEKSWDNEDCVNNEPDCPWYDPSKPTIKRTTIKPAPKTTSGSGGSRKGFK